MRNERSDNLDWLAFCYLADELPAEEATAFEERLAVDQAAREAVAEAVELTCAVNVTCAEADALDHTTTAAPSAIAGQRSAASFATRLAWTAIAASACLLVVLAYQYNRGVVPVADSQSDVTTEEADMSTDQRSRQLAVLWSETREELESVELVDWMGDSEEALEDSDQPQPFLNDETDVDDLYAVNDSPSWMVAAVLATDDSSMTEEN